VRPTWWQNNEDQVELAAGHVWRSTRSSQNDADVCRFISNIPDSQLGHAGADITRQQVLFKTKWLDSGRVRLQSSATFAAALASTTMSGLRAGDIRVPWPAFRVEIPNGLVDSDDISWQFVDVAILDDSVANGLDLPGLIVPGMVSVHLRGYRLNGRTMPRVHLFMDDIVSLSDFDGISGSNSVLADDIFGRPGVEVPDNDAKDRATVVAARLVIGLLYTIGHQLGHVDVPVGVASHGLCCVSTGRTDNLIRAVAFDKPELHRRLDNRKRSI